MKCTTHDRQHCSHCAVLARCEAQFYGTLAHGIVVLDAYQTLPRPSVDARRTQLSLATQRMAARLVAWIRWVGSCPVHPHHAPIQLVDSTLWLCSWESASHICTYFARDATPDHPLDPLGLTWAQRVAMSSEECLRCKGTGQYTKPDPSAMGIDLGVLCRCDGIAWDFVSIIADQLDKSAVVDWSMVHEFREPADIERVIEMSPSRTSQTDRYRIHLNALTASSGVPRRLLYDGEV